MTTTLEALKIACPAMRPIAFEDIRKGDVIVMTRAQGQFVEIATAKSKDLDGDWAMSDESYIEPHYKGLYLLHRPKPELPTEPGDMIHADPGNIYVRIDADVWRNMRSGFIVEDRVIRKTAWERVYLTTKEPDNE